MMNTKQAPRRRRDVLLMFCSTSSGNTCTNGGWLSVASISESDFQPLRLSRLVNSPIWDILGRVSPRGWTSQHTASLKVTLEELTWDYSIWQI